MLNSLPPLRLRLLVTASVCILVIIYLIRGLTYSFAVDIGVGNRAKANFNDTSLQIAFWETFQPLLASHAPDVEPPQQSEKANSTRFNPKDDSLRPDLMTMPSEDIQKMKTLHTSFVAALRNNQYRSHYVPGTRGLVSTAGGPYLPVLTVSLRMLRNRGSTLPMEVFLGSEEEYESYICEEVFPPLNAKCIVLEKILEAAPADISHYQYKPFALLFSSFEEVLFLDADSFPLHDPNVLFVSDPFASIKMVTWPDFWGSSASPLYYEIASQPVLPLTTRASTESGEILISKKTHQKTLMLSLYYNYYGPSYYYRLFSQGAAGEGDKETFIAAATVMREPFYQVNEPLRAIGHRAEGGMAGSAMVQFDPIEDYELTHQGIWRGLDSSPVADSPRPFFIHANVPKFNPATIFDDHAIDPVRDSEGKWIRPWTVPHETIDEFEEDIEKLFWTEIMWVGCELEDKFESWKDKKDVCNKIKKYWNAVFEGEWEN